MNAVVLLSCLFALLVVSNAQNDDGTTKCGKFHCTSKQFCKRETIYIVFGAYVEKHYEYLCLPYQEEGNDCDNDWFLCTPGLNCVAKEGNALGQKTCESSSYSSTTTPTLPQQQA